EELANVKRLVLQLWIALTVAVLASLLALAAFWLARSNEHWAEQEAREKGTQAERAGKAAKEANGQAQIAETRRLVTLSEVERDKHFDRALLLAVEALGTRDTFEARNSLFRTLHARPGLKSFLHVQEGGGVTGVAFSPDGKALAGGYGGSAVLWERD